MNICTMVVLMQAIKLIQVKSYKNESSYKTALKSQTDTLYREGKEQKETPTKEKEK